MLKTWISRNSILHQEKSMCQGPKTGTSLTISEERKESVHTGGMTREKDSCKARAVRAAGAKPSSRERMPRWRWLLKCSGTTFHFERSKEWVAGVWDGPFVNGKMKTFLCFWLKYRVTSSNVNEEWCLKWRYESILKNRERINMIRENRWFYEPRFKERQVIFSILKGWSKYIDRLFTVA